MSYVTEADLRSAVPVRLLTEALDANRDGALDDDLLAAVLAGADQQVDGLLQGRYPVPFAAPIPKPVLEAAKVFACEAVYLHRGMSAENNPFASRAEFWRRTLRDVAAGRQPLAEAAADSPNLPPGSAILDTVTLDASMR